MSNADHHDPTECRDRLRRVIWIGGASGAGKSTVARQLGSVRDWRVYATDDVMADHARRCTADLAPALGAFARMTMDERWVDRTPATMLATFHWFRGEGFVHIVDDLVELSAHDGVVAEGFRLLPRQVAPLLDDRRRAVWLLPTPDFRRAAIEARPEDFAFLQQTSDPSRALDNLLTRDEMFTEHLRDELRSLGLAAIDVDGSMNPDELTALVAARLDG